MTVCSKKEVAAETAASFFVAWRVAIVWDSGYLRMEFDDCFFNKKRRRQMLKNNEGRIVLLGLSSYQVREKRD